MPAKARKTIVPRIALKIAYEGTHFFGWQRQQGLRTVQEELTRALSRVADEPVEPVCAGRTDKGVHACAQVVHFDTGAERSVDSWILGGNANLPDDIVIRRAVIADDTFHARFSAVERTYRYIIYNRRHPLACQRQYVTWVTYPLSVELMHEAGQHLIGEHDFSAFRAAGCQAKSPLRRMTALSVTRRDDLCVLTVTANAFLHHMVRNIAGVLLKIGRGQETPQWAAQVLARRQRSAAGVTAPASGLHLTAVGYPEPYRFFADADTDTPFLLAW